MKCVDHSFHSFTHPVNIQALLWVPKAKHGMKSGPSHHGAYILWVPKMISIDRWVHEPIYVLKIGLSSDPTSVDFGKWRVIRD